MLLQNLLRVLVLPAIIIWLVLGTLDVVLNLLLTSHLGDSGMKKKPKSNTSVGIIRPAIANTYLVLKSLY
jgi:hypothetical protein